MDARGLVEHESVAQHTHVRSVIGKFLGNRSSIKLASSLFQRLNVGDQIGTILWLLQTGEHHLGARDVLFRVLQVLEQGLLVPGDAWSMNGGVDEQNESS